MVRVGAGLEGEPGHSSLAFPAAMGLSRDGGCWGCLLLSLLGGTILARKSPGQGEPEFGEAIPGTGEAAATIRAREPLLGRVRADCLGSSLDTAS